jgi:hypothetical protein
MRQRLACPPLLQGKGSGRLTLRQSKRTLLTNALPVRLHP